MYTVTKPIQPSLLLVPEPRPKLPPVKNHISISLVGSVVGLALKRKNAHPKVANYYNVLLVVELIEKTGYDLTMKLSDRGNILGFRGPLTRDIPLHNFGVNAEFAGNP